MAIRYFSSGPKLEKVEEFLDSIIEHVPQMIFVKDALELRFVRFNKAGEKLLGYTRQEIMGKNDYDFFPKEQADCFTTVDYDVLKSKSITVIPEEPIQTQNQGMRYLQTIKIPILDTEGRALYLLCISEDITERKMLEELRRSNKDLEGFAYIASHDLKAPLRQVCFYVDLMLENLKGHNIFSNLETEHSLKRIKSALNRMGSLINDLLDFSCIVPFDKTSVGGLQKVNVLEVVENVLQDLATTIAEKSATINIANLVSLPHIQANPIHLRQLFTNLISNALKYSRPSAVPQIEIDCQYQPHQQTQFSVRDNGVGIPEQYQGELFKIFHRLPSSYQHIEGNGIGLALCKKIVQLYDGEIWVKSNEQEGCTFHFTLKNCDDKSL